MIMIHTGDCFERKSAAAWRKRNQALYIFPYFPCVSGTFLFSDADGISSSDMSLFNAWESVPLAAGGKGIS